MKNNVISILVLLFNNLTFAQVMEMAWYDMTYTEEQIQEQKNRDYRAEHKIKSVSIVDTTDGNQISVEEFDKKGRTVYFKSEHRSSYSKSNGFYNAEDLLINEWKYKYDSKGNLIKADNFHEIYQGKVYGMGHGSDGEYGLPTVGGPFVKDTMYVNAAWAYTYDKNGLKISQSEYIAPDPYKYQSLNSYRVYNNQGAAKWRYEFEYNRKGQLIRRLEFRSDINQDEPTYVREFEYNKEDYIVKEVKKSGEKIMKETTLEYDSRGNIIEKKAQYSKITFKFNEDNLLSKVELFNHKDVSKNTISYIYEREILVEKKVKGMVVNQYYRPQTYTYTLDKKGRLLTKTNNSKVYTYSYY